MINLSKRKQDEILLHESLFRKIARIDGWNKMPEVVQNFNWMEQI